MGERDGDMQGVRELPLPSRVSSRARFFLRPPTSKRLLRRVPYYKIVCVVQVDWRCVVYVEWFVLHDYQTYHLL